MIRHWTITMAAAALIAAQSLDAWAAAPAGDSADGHVVLVVDCSAHMSEPLNADGKTSRLEAAREAAGGLLTKLAKDEKHGVTLVLLGHRIAAGGGEDGATAQDVQVEYLRLTGDKLERVPPGLDVEIVRESRPLKSDQVAGYEKSLATVKPWGESPLWLAIERAAESAPPTEAGRSNRIILLTNGTNEQSGVTEAATASQALESLKLHHASLHVIQLGKARSATDLAALLRTAQASGGSVLVPHSARQAAEAALIAAGLQAPRAAVNDPLVRPTAQVQPAVQVEDVQPPPPLEVAPDPNDDLRKELRYYDFAVDVTYWGQPVKDATVYLRGKSFDVKYERADESADKALREERLKGRYVFLKVVKGVYLLDITVNHKNRRYAIEREVIIDENLLGAGAKATAIQIERSKDPVPPAQ
jgi:hypothetical protein